MRGSTNPGGKGPSLRCAFLNIMLGIFLREVRSLYHARPPISVFVTTRGRNALRATAKHLRPLELILHQERAIASKSFGSWPT